MKKYLQYIILGTIILIGGVYYAVSAQKGNNTQNTNTVDLAAMGHDTNTPVAQSHRGYNLQLTSATESIKAGQSTKISYKITNDKGEVLKDYMVAHEKIMHFIIVRKDLQGFQHLHPDFNQSTGEFTVNVTFPTDGPYRIFPDFTPTPENPQKLTVTLNKDINVGDLTKYKPQALTIDTATSKTAGGFTIDYFIGSTPKTGAQLDYGLTVSDPKVDAQIQLEPYLGAMGHGVIIKEGTLEFIHTHASGMDMEGMEGMSAAEHAGHMPEPDTVDFSTKFSEAGTYKIFTQFQVKGKVVTSDYVIKVD
jgi:hypothetical protein